MNKRQAKRIAHRIAYRFVQQALEVGGDEALVEDPEATEADQERVESALDAIAQRHYELGCDK